MNLYDFLVDSEWWHPDKMQRFFEWVTSPEVESSGEGRRQLGYFDGYNGDEPSTSQSDYMRGYAQGVAMRKVSAEN